MKLVNDDEFVVFRLMRQAVANPDGVLMRQSERTGRWIVFQPEGYSPAQALAECLRVQAPVTRMRVFTAAEAESAPWAEIIW